MFLTRRLENLGYSTDAATDGLEAVSKAQEGSFEVILMDIGMPGISGLEAAERIRAWEESTGRARTPIVALTAHTYDEDIRRSTEAGMDSFVSKPIRDEKLQEARSAVTKS